MAQLPELGGPPLRRQRIEHLCGGRLRSGRSASANGADGVAGVAAARAHSCADRTQPDRVRCVEAHRLVVAIDGPALDTRKM